MNGRSYIQRLLQVINPRVYIGGLEISDAFLRYVLFRDGEAVARYVRLEPGIIVDGRVVQAEKYREALRVLRAQIGTAGEPVHAIVSLAASAVYSQPLSLPPLSPERVAEAIRLNLQMISPMDVTRAYYDAEQIGIGPSGESEFLGAFADSTFIDEHIAALGAAGFIAVAVEFSGLSVARAFRELGAGYDFAKPHLIAHVFSSGIDFLVIRNGRLHSHHFSPWTEGAAGGREIDEAALGSMVREEFRRVLHFYAGKWSDALASVVVVGKGLEPLVARVVAEESGLSAASFAAASYGAFFPQWAIAVGAALRGNMRRADDVFVSLAPVGTEDAFARSRRAHFIVSWRNAVFAVAGFLFFVFLLSDSILARIAATEADMLARGLAAVEAQEVERLRAEAAAFNRKIDLAFAAKRKSTADSRLFAKLFDIAGTAITFTRVYHDTSGRVVLVSGLASSELAAINFKNNLAKHPEFAQDVTLPLATIVQEKAGNVSFHLSFREAEGF